MIARGQNAGPAGRNRAVAGHVRRGVVAVDEGPIGHDEMDLDRHGVGPDLPGDELDEGVGHDLTLAAVVTSSFGGQSSPTQRGMHGDRLRDG